MRDDFAPIAEWVRRHKLNVVRSSDERKLLHTTLLCLRKGEHIYSVSPDMDYVQEGDNKNFVPGASALIWSTGILRCDDYFLISDDGDRITLRRFIHPPDMREDGSYPSNPEYPTIGAYYYEQQGRKIVWKFVADRDVDDTTWKLWHAALAGFKIEATNIRDLDRRLAKHSAAEGLTLDQQRYRDNQGFARFVSNCGGVKGVVVTPYHSGLTCSILFDKGEPYRIHEED